MSSGTKQLVVNPRERAVSDDINRLQAFAGADVAELLRNLYAGALGNVALDQASSPPSANTSPNAAVILNGILAQPQIASINLLVTPGALLSVDPELVVIADDSPGHFIDDPGITAGGVLTLTPNSSGATRIDVVEFARVRSDRDGQGTLDTASLAIETSSRDIYNTVTGAFAPATVTKVYNYGRLTYRIRTGTPGSGFPGTVTGWTPIMVASVPTGTTTWDNAVCWDVRPMVEDYSPQQAAHSSSFFTRSRVAGKSNLFADPTDLIMLGTLEGQFGSTKVGGVMPVAGYTFKNDGSFDDIATGTLGQGLPVIAGGQAFFIYAALPFGLPRWMELNPATLTNRLPNGFRGVLVATQDVLPANNNGTPAAALTAPAYTGLGLLTGGISALVSVSDVGPDGFGNQVISPPSMVDDELFLGLAATVTNPSSGVFNIDLSDGNPGGRNNPIVPGTRKLRLVINFTLTTTAGNNGTFEVSSVDEITTGTLTIDSDPLPVVTTATLPSSNASQNAVLVVDCYLNKQYPVGSGATTRTLQVTTVVSGGTTVSTPSAIVDKNWL